MSQKNLLQCSKTFDMELGRVELLILWSSDDRNFDNRETVTHVEQGNARTIFVSSCLSKLNLTRELDNEMHNSWRYVQLRTLNTFYMYIDSIGSHVITTWKCSSTTFVSLYWQCGRRFVQLEWPVLWSEHTHNNSSHRLEHHLIQRLLPTLTTQGARQTNAHEWTVRQDSMPSHGKQNHVRAKDEHDYCQLGPPRIGKV